MNITNLLKIIQLATSLAPVVAGAIAEVKKQTGKSTQEILDHANVQLDEAERKLLDDLLKGE